MKHVLPQHIIFQFACVNTIEEQLLENITVNMDVLSGPYLETYLTVALPQLTVNREGFTYVCFIRPTVRSYN